MNRDRCPAMSADELAAQSGFNVKMSFATGNVSENWRMFKRQLQYYFDSKFTLGQLNERRKVGILMSALGRDGIEVYDTLFTTEEAPLFATILTRFDEFCLPRKNTVFERSVYFRLAQKPDQKIDTFILELKRQAALCEFASVERENLIRDMLVIGIRDDKLREELLRDAELNLDKAIQACKTRERTQNEASIMASQNSTVVSVDRVQQNQRPKSQPGKQSSSCRNCGYSHGNTRPCPALRAACKNCKQTGHFIKVCPNAAVAAQPAKTVQAVEQQPEGSVAEPKVDLLRIYNCTLESPSPPDTEKAWHIDMRLGASVVTFKLDTAAECNTLSVQDYEKLVPRPSLQPTPHIIKPYNAPPFRPLGRVVLQYQSKPLEFLVMPGCEENLLGFKSCRELQLIQRVSRLLNLISRKQFLENNADLFQGVGKIPGLHKIHLKPDATPRVARWRRFAYTLQDKLVKTLREMESQDVIEPVREPTDWVSNITVVEKTDGTLRVCLDPQTLNNAIQIPKYQIPKTDDILVHLSEMILFTVLDLKSGFWHLELDTESSKLTTFNSPIGRYRFKRLCFGINCAPEIFMATMVRIFGDIPNVYPYFDDLIIAARSEAEHDETLRQICIRARQYNVKFNSDKLQYKQTSVQFLGLVISKEGIQPAQKHIRAMLEMPKPHDKQAVLRFLGLVKFLSRFIPNVSKLTANLRALTHKEAEFVWKTEHDGEFEYLKKLIVSQPILRYFDVTKPVLVQTDSSKDGLGSVLLQEDQPVAFASRALTPAEAKYSQIEKELLAIVFAVEKFHDYVYGLPILVHSDHRPLEAILKKDLDKVSPRLQRLRLRLLKYNVDVQYKPGKQMLVADALSRAYLTDETPDLSYQSVTVHSVSSLAVTSEKAAQLVAETRNDPTLSKVVQWIETDTWPASSKDVPQPLAQFVTLKPFLSLENGVLFYENRLVIPATLRPMILTRLHEGHLGIEKTKRLARDTVYWPGLTTDIVTSVKACEVCNKFARNNVKEKLSAYPIPTYPWQQLAIDIANFSGKDYLVIVDKFSNWPEIVTLQSKTANEIVAHLSSLFARHGIPESIVSDNNPFNSAAYNTFAQEWGFEPIFTSPHYPQSNGHAERTVQTVKMMLRKCQEDGTSLHYALLQYRNTPLADTGFSPAQVLMGRRLRTKLPVASQILHPQCVPRDQVIASKEKSQALQQFYYDRAASEPPRIEPSATVWVKDTLADKKWQPAHVLTPGKSPNSFVVEKENGAGVVTRNRRFLRPRNQISCPARYAD